MVAQGPGPLDVSNWSEDRRPALLWCPPQWPQRWEAYTRQAIFYLPGLRPVDPASSQHLCAVCHVDVQLYLLTRNDGWLRG